MPLQIRETRFGGGSAREGVEQHRDLRDALAGLGAELRHVYRTRTLLTRIDDWEAVGRVHGEFFGDVRPANTVMEVLRFIDPEWLVEFEADALVDDVD